MVLNGRLFLVCLDFSQLFPDTADNRAAQTGAEWAAGGNKDPLKTSMVAIHEAGGVSASTTAATAAGLVAATARLSVAPTEAAPTAAVTSPTTTVSPTATRPSAGSVSVAAARDRGASQVRRPHRRACLIPDMDLFSPAVLFLHRHHPLAVLPLSGPGRDVCAVEHAYGH